MILTATGAIAPTNLTRNIGSRLAEACAVLVLAPSPELALLRSLGWLAMLGVNAATTS